MMEEENKEEAPEPLIQEKQPEKGEGKIVQLKESEHKKLLEEAVQGKEYKDKYIRLYAEFDNARKRMERERIEFTKYANEELISEFLSVLDDLERSVEAARSKHEDYAAFLKGVEMVMAHIYEMLKENGVKPIDTKGKMFDPHCHEVLMQEENDKAPEGMVLEEFQKGYFLGDRIVRTAKVKVATSKK